MDFSFCVGLWSLAGFLCSYSGQAIETGVTESMLKLSLPEICVCGSPICSSEQFEFSHFHIAELQAKWRALFFRLKVLTSA